MSAEKAMAGSTQVPVAARRQGDCSATSVVRLPLQFLWHWIERSSPGLSAAVASRPQRLPPFTHAGRVLHHIMSASPPGHLSLCCSSGLRLCSVCLYLCCCATSATAVWQNHKQEIRLTDNVWPARAQRSRVLDDEREVVVLGGLLQREARQRARPARRGQI